MSSLTEFSPTYFGGEIVLGNDAEGFADHALHVWGHGAHVVDHGPLDSGL